MMTAIGRSPFDIPLSHSPPGFEDTSVCQCSRPQRHTAHLHFILYRPFSPDHSLTGIPQSGVMMVAWSQLNHRLGCLAPPCRSLLCRVRRIQTGVVGEIGEEAQRKAAAQGPRGSVYDGSTLSSRLGSRKPSSTSGSPHLPTPDTHLPNQGPDTATSSDNQPVKHEHPNLQVHLHIPWESNLRLISPPLHSR